MVDIDQDGVKPPARAVGVETPGRGREHRKEIAVDQPGPGVGRQVDAERKQSSLMPLDHLRKRIDKERVRWQHPWLAAAKGYADKLGELTEILRQSRPKQASS